jgi:NAD(P)-dependent dehydrogenase (short-subunit alcohol dehydrogenase family)
VPGRLEGKVCVITGAGGGMGREAAILFSEEGAQVCAADVNEEAAQQTASDARDAFAIQVDVADESSVKAMMDATAPASRRTTTRACSTRALRRGTACRT